MEYKDLKLIPALLDKFINCKIFAETLQKESQIRAVNHAQSLLLCLSCSIIIFIFVGQNNGFFLFDLVPGNDVGEHTAPG